jgi:hypothetical protein
LPSAPSVSALSPSETAELEVRQARGFGLSHARRRRAHLIFRGTHVGSLAQRLGGDGQDQVAGRLRHRRRRGENARQVRRRLAGQHRERMRDLLDAALQGRQAGAGLFRQGPRLLAFQAVDQASLQAPLRHLQGRQLAGQIVGSDRQLRLRTRAG